MLPLLSLFAVIYWGRESLYLYQQTYSPKLEYARYQNSAYFQGDSADYILSDEQVNVVRGVEQLIIKKDPLDTLPGHPYLAPYFYALSVILFQNPYYASLLAFTLCLLAMMVIAKKLTKNWGLICVVLALFILDPLFNEALFTTMLDVYLLLFSLCAVYFLLQFYDTKKMSYGFLSSLFLGFCLSTKFYPSTLPLLGAIALTTILKQDFKLFKRHLMTLPLIFVGFILGNFSFFIHHFDPLIFIRYQRFIQNWWAGSPNVESFLVFKIIFLNQWQTWWDKKEIINLPYWTPIWGILLISSSLLLKKMSSKHTVLFLLWIVLSFSMFSFMAIYPRHLLAVLPALYLSLLIPGELPQRSTETRGDIL